MADLIERAQNEAAYQRPPKSAEHDPFAEMVRARYPRLARSYPHIFGEQV